MPGELLLCVDDRAANLQMRKLVLESAGYQVLTAGDGNFALRLFTSNPVALVVLDYNMPPPNGATVARRMRELKPAVPLLMLSAHFTVPPDAAGVVDAYVTKGDNPRVLLERIGQLLQGKRLR